MEYLIVGEELYHHGIKGQKWGVRRWQNSDGTFNAAGKERYFGNGAGENYHKLSNKSSGNKSEVKSSSNEGRKGLSDKQKKALKIGAAVAGTALVAYGAYKLNDKLLDKNYEKQFEAVQKYVTDMQKSNEVQRLSYLMSGNYKEYDKLADRNIKIGNMAFESIQGNRRAKFDPKKIDQQIRQMDRQNKSQDLVRKMMEEGMKNGGIYGNYKFSDIGINNMGFDLRK